MSSISDLSTLQTGHDDNLSTVQGGGIGGSGKAASAAGAGAGASGSQQKQRASLTPASDVANMNDLAEVRVWGGWMCVGGVGVGVGCVCVCVCALSVHIIMSI